MPNSQSRLIQRGQVGGALIPSILTPPPPSVLSERCSLAVVVAAVTAASLTAAKKSESCAWVTAELCWCTRYVGVALTAEASHSTLISKCQ